VHELRLNDRMEVYLLKKLIMQAKSNIRKYILPPSFKCSFALIVSFVFSICSSGAEGKDMEVDAYTGLHLNLPGETERSSSSSLHAEHFKFVNRVEPGKPASSIVIGVGSRFDFFRQQKLIRKENGKILNQDIVWYEKDGSAAARQTLLHVPERPDILIYIELECHDTESLKVIESAFSSFVVANRSAPAYQHGEMARMFSMRGDLRNEVAEYQKHLAAHPDDLCAGQHLAFALRKSKRYVEALDVWSKLIDRQEMPFWRDRAVVLFDLGRYEQCIADCKRAVKSEPKNYQAFELSSKAHLALKQTSLAIDDLSKAVECNPNPEYPLFDRARLYRLQGKFQLAVEDCTRALKEGPFRTDQFLAERAENYRLLGKLQLAADDREELRIFNANTIMHIGGKRILPKPNKEPVGTPDIVPEGLSQLEYYHLAKSYGGLRPKQCLQCIKLVETMDPTRPVAAKATRLRDIFLPKTMPPDEAVALNLKAFNEFSQPDQCRKDATECVRRFPDWEYGYITLGALEKDLNNQDAAVKNFRKALEINPHNVTALSRLGDALRWSNEKEAKEVLQKAVELDPEDTFDAHIIKLLSH